jgi:hypothetical protein
MKTFTVQCGYAAYYFRTETIQAETLDEALDKANAAANQNSNWASADVCGNTFIDAAAEGNDVDLWDDGVRQLPIPARFTEGGEGPHVTVTVSGGLVQDVEIAGGAARVLVRDYDTDGTSDPDAIQTDAQGERYLLADWSNDIPSAEAAE